MAVERRAAPESKPGPLAAGQQKSYDGLAGYDWPALALQSYLSKAEKPGIRRV